MKRIHLAVLVGVLALGTSSLAAQGTTPTTKKAATAQHDSLKTVKKTIKTNKAARKTAKAKGDTATARKLKNQLKAEKKTKAALKAETGKTTTTPPAKKP